MAYNIFSQLQGPQIDVRLFGEAAEAGAKIGQEIPTPLTSAIQGVEQGVKFGTDLTQQYAQIQAIQQENQIRQTQADAAVATHDVNVQLAQQQADNQLNQAELTAGDLKNQKEINAILASNDPAKLGSIYSNPDYLGTLNRNAQLADNTSRAVVNNPYIDPGVKAQASAFTNLQRQAQYAAATARLLNATRRSQVDNEYGKAISQAAGIISGASGTDLNGPLALNEDQILQYHAVPVSKYKIFTDENGNQVVDPNAPPPSLADVLQQQQVFGTHVMLNGNKVAGPLSKQEFDNYNKSIGILAERRTFSGLPTITRGPQVGATQQAPTPGAAPALPTLGAPEAQAGPTPTPIAGTNQAIVDQNRDAFRQLEANPPPGVLKGSLDTQYQQYLNAIRQGVAQAQQGKLAEQGASETAQKAATQAATPAVTPGPKPPTEAVSQVLKQNVSLNLDEQPVISNAVFTRVNSNPLLANKSPLLKGLAAQESRGVSDAESETGVQGLLQVTKRTAAMYGLNRDIPEQQVRAAELYLYDLGNMFNGNIPLMLAGYSAAGPGTVQQAIRDTGSTNWPTVRDRLQQILSPSVFRQVKNYPDKVISYATQFMGGNGEADLNFAYALQRNGLLKPKEEAV